MGIILGFLGCSDRYPPCMHVIAIDCGVYHTYSMHQVWVGCPLRLVDALSTFIGRCDGRLKDIHAGAFNTLEDMQVSKTSLRLLANAKFKTLTDLPRAI